MSAGTMRDIPALDKVLDDLRSGASGWAALPLRDKVAMLEALPRRVFDLAPRMVGAAADAKGIAPTSSWIAPRSLLNGELTLSPKPVFFITNKTAVTTTRRLAKFLVHRNPIALIFVSALRG